MSQVLGGLALAHAQGVIHRDVKPENVLLDRTAQPARPLVTDFGIARLMAESRLTLTPGPVGTPEYMAPEQAEEQSITTAVDVYGAGVMLYELTSGVTPYAGGTALLVLRRHLERSPGRPATFPDALWAQIIRMMARDPALRPPATAAAGELALLASQLADLPPSPRLEIPPETTPPIDIRITIPAPPPTFPPPIVSPPTPPSPRRRPAKRPGRRALLAAFAAIALIAAVSGTALTLHFRQTSTTPTLTGPGTSTSPSDATPSATNNETSSASSPTPASPEPVTTAPQLTVLPNFVGGNLSDAQAILTSAGVQTKVLDVLEEDTRDGTILAQSPKAGAAVNGPVTLTVAQLAVVQYLSDTQPVEQENFDLGAGRQSVNGKLYINSVYFNTNPPIGRIPDEDSAGYDLGRAYRRFRTVAGLADNTRSGELVEFEIDADGAPVQTFTLALGQTKTIDMDVTGVLRLTIKEVDITPMPSGPRPGSAVFGDARLLGAPGEVPDPTPTS